MTENSKHIIKIGRKISETIEMLKAEERELKNIVIVYVTEHLETRNYCCSILSDCDEDKTEWIFKQAFYRMKNAKR